MTQVIKFENTPIVEKIKGQENAYWVQSFDPKKQQLYYKVEFSLEDNVVNCTCKSWKFHSCEGICKHMSRLLEVIS